MNKKLSKEKKVSFDPITAVVGHYDQATGSIASVPPRQQWKQNKQLPPVRDRHNSKVANIRLSVLFFFTVCKQSFYPFH